MRFSINLGDLMVMAGALILALNDKPQGAIVLLLIGVFGELASIRQELRAAALARKDGAKHAD